MKLTKGQRANVRREHDEGARSRGGFWITLLIQVALVVLGDLLRPKPEIENAKPAGLGDFRIPTATEGRPVPMGWGTFRVEGANTIWDGDLRQTPITVKVKTGLFSSERQITGYRYNFGMQQAFCMGELDDMTKVWIGEDLVGDFTSTPIVDGGTYTINKPELYGGEKLGSGGIVGTFQFFAGSNSQVVSPYLAGKGVASATIAAAGTGYGFNDVVTEDGNGTASTRATYRVITIFGIPFFIEQINGGNYSVQSSSPAATTVSPSGGTGMTLNLTYANPRFQEGGVTPAYHDIAYNIPAETAPYMGTSTTVRPWKWEVRRFPNGLALTSGRERVDGGANPANVLFEIMTNKDWGRGIDAAIINTANFTTAGNTLHTEGNGFSFLLDRVEDIGDLIRRIEEQIEGVLRKNPLTGLWTIKLIRKDYDIDTVPNFNDSNIIRIESWSAGTYEGTSNQVRVPFNDEGDNYKDTYGFAQDMANVLIVGENISVTISHPGVKTATLANAIAWRELRSLSIPLSAGTFVMDRSVYGILPGDACSFTNAELGLVKFPIRLNAVDYGELLAGEIRVELVQDVFETSGGVFADAPNSGWVPPSDSLIPFPVLQQLAFEAPRMFTLRDPNTLEPDTDKVWAAGRRQGPEATFQMFERNGASDPTVGAYELFGEVYQFMLVGNLTAALAIATSSTSASVSVTPGLDTIAALAASFPTTLDDVELGTDLASLMYIGTADGTVGEFLVCRSAADVAGALVLTQVYRGMGDTSQKDHAIGARVFFVFRGGGMSDDTVIAGNFVDVKLLPHSAFGDVAEGDATEIEFEMDNRVRRPYSVASFELNNTELDTTSVSLIFTGSVETLAVQIDDILRKDFRTVDEVAAVLTDAGTLFSDFPSANTTQTTVEVRDGSTVVASVAAFTGTSTTVLRLDILEGLGDTDLPASLTFAVGQSHTFASTVYASRDFLEVVATIDDVLVGQLAWGALDQAVESTKSFTVVADSVDHVFALTTSFAVGDVEYELNDDASWVPLIVATGTAGTILAAALSNGDTIKIRHGSTDTDPQKLLTMSVSGTIEAYGVLIS